MQAPEQRLLSVIVPVYNEVDNLESLVEALLRVMDREAYRFEIVFVDDGSTDGSADRLDAIARRDSRCKIVHFRRNFGQTAAMLAAMSKAVMTVLPVMSRLQRRASSPCR